MYGNTFADRFNLNGSPIMRLKIIDFNNFKMFLYICTIFSIYKLQTGLNKIKKTRGKPISPCEKSITGCGKTTTGCGKSITGCETTTTGCEKSITGCGKPTTGCEKSITGRGKPTTGCGKSITGCGKTTTGCEKSITGRGKTITAYRTPIPPGIGEILNNFRSISIDLKIKNIKMED